MWYTLFHCTLDEKKRHEVNLWHRLFPAQKETGKWSPKGFCFLYWTKYNGNAWHKWPHCHITLTRRRCSNIEILPLAGLKQAKASIKENLTSFVFSYNCYYETTYYCLGLWKQVDHVFKNILGWVFFIFLLFIIFIIFSFFFSSSSSSSFFFFFPKLTIFCVYHCGIHYAISL